MTRFTLDGRTIDAEEGETLFAAARRHGVELPHLCHKEGLGSPGNCRACVVEIEGERALAPSCCRQPREGMVVHAMGGRAQAARRGVIELLLGEAPAADGELGHWAEVVGARRAAPPAPSFSAVAVDTSHPAITFDANACIRCTRCVIACRDIQNNDVIGLSARGEIVFDAGAPLGESSCVACGECVAACPTGALQSRQHDSAEKLVASLCPYCGVGCQLTYQVAGNAIVGVLGRNGPANAERLCVKGRYGYDYPRHPDRLTTPLIRRAGAPKDARLSGSKADWRTQFREASWEEALALAAGGLARIKATHGPAALAGFGSAKGSNEEAYLFQKLVRLGFGNHNVDHCTRLCHASSVAALLEGIGSGAVSNPVRDVAFANVIIVIGANPVSNHPVAASFIKNAARRGAKLIVIDPRATELARDATHALHFKPDSDVLLLNSLLHTIVFEGLADEAFVAARVDGFDAAYRENLKAYAPEAVCNAVGIPAATLREVARLYATAKAAMIFWGMGISQHTHGTDNVRCLIALALLAGQIGRPGTGLHPLRGQNNVQGASDAGLIPMMLPNYQRVADPAVREHFAKFWGAPLSAVPGLTVTEIIAAANAHVIRGMYIVGENPAMSDPDLNHAREGLARLEHLVVQDIFLTETAALADVILPASSCAEKTGSFTNTDRTVQIGRAALTPPGGARQDLELIGEMGRRLGLDWNYADPAAVFEEMRQAMRSISGITWARLDREEAVTYPCATLDDPGHPIIFTENFPTANGRGRILPVSYRHAAETPDADYPWVLITGRQLEHWHTGAMTRRSAVLDRLEPSPYINLHPDDLAELKVGAGETVRLLTRRGELAATARLDAGLPRHTVFMPFCYVEAAANLLTNPALDPFGKIPEFKYCAVRIEPGADFHEAG
ncbi:MAG: formate dehydrogenase subunit alpha [Betaproteobacteria bacterium HGW-Betaproteobacteria-11]|nr:MAG: formate dehydrogenase subunit alpha [Betaproteobacteria bacterium HGW-Betaproteobacteria-11]